MKKRMGERDGTGANRTAITSLNVLTQLWSSPQAGNGGSISRSASGQGLNEIFVSWLMGIPFWWAKAEPMPFAVSEIQSYRSALRQRLSNLCGEH